MCAKKIDIYKISSRATHQSFGFLVFLLRRAEIEVERGEEEEEEEEEGVDDG